MIGMPTLSEKCAFSALSTKQSFVVQESDKVAYGCIDARRLPSRITVGLRNMCRRAKFIPFGLLRSPNMPVSV